MKAKIYLNILNQNQKDLLPLIKQYQSDYYLVGGTAIALYIGHRESLDFGLFTYKSKNQLKTIIDLQKRTNLSVKSIFQSKDQAHFIVNDVKLTFFNFYFNIPAKIVFDGIKMPNLLTLAAMKAFALGGRAKWKDYVDLYFILKNNILLDDIIIRANELFNSETSTLFNFRNFLEQLMYFEDINYEEEVIYCGNHKPTQETVKEYLTNISLDYLTNKGLNNKV